MKSIPPSIALLTFAAGIGLGLYFGQASPSVLQEQGKKKPLFEERAAKGRSIGSDLKTNDKAPQGGNVIALVEQIASQTPSELETSIRTIRRHLVLGEAGEVLKQSILLQALASADPDRALKLASEMDFRGDGSATAFVLSVYAEKDPAAAAAQIKLGEGYAPDPKASLAAESVAVVWARQDPEAAKHWVEGLPNGLQSRPREAVATVLASTDPGAAVGYALEIPAFADRIHSCAKVAEIWARTSPEAALSWAASLDSESRRTALPAAINTLAEQDPSSAAAWLLRQAPESHLPQNSAALIGSWVRRDPVAAAQWVRELPPSMLQKEAIQHLVYEWSASDPERASAWLRNQPEGEARDEAAATLSLQSTAADPEAAAVWAASISDPVRRTAELQRTFSAWLRQDHDTATNWMQNTEPRIR